MQQQPAFKVPLNAITTEQIQKYLEDNKNLILAILECQKLGKYQECAQYQAVLQKNLMYLAAIADAQPPTPQTPNPSQTANPSQASSGFFVAPNSIPQTSSFMQQPPQQLSSGHKLPFELNSMHAQDQQQQLLQFQQQQQQFQAQMGFRAGAQNGLFGIQSANATGIQQDGSELANYGGDGRGMFFDNGSFRDS